MIERLRLRRLFEFFPTDLYLIFLAELVKLIHLRFEVIVRPKLILAFLKLLVGKIHRVLIHEFRPVELFAPEVELLLISLVLNGFSFSAVEKLVVIPQLVAFTRPSLVGELFEFGYLVRRSRRVIVVDLLTDGLRVGVAVSPGKSRRLAHRVLHGDIARREVLILVLLIQSVRSRVVGERFPVEDLVHNILGNHRLVRRRFLRRRPDGGVALILIYRIDRPQRMRIERFGICSSLTGIICRPHHRCSLFGRPIRAPSRSSVRRS